MSENVLYLLEQARREGIIHSHTMYMDKFGELTLTVYKAAEQPSLWFEQMSLDGLTAAVRAALAKLRRKPVEQMDADELEAELKAAGVTHGNDLSWCSAGRVLGYHPRREDSERLTVFWRRIVTDIREQQDKQPGTPAGKDWHGN